MEEQDLSGTYPGEDEVSGARQRPAELRHAAEVLRSVHLELDDASMRDAW
ncbi:hypothetical protein [Nocardia cyriacigeorgica]|nr:hypothetical protein [Nocardia cyriacigeorgica]MBF6285348.1 hypothetical protein [Nocardia cyriacigeorgica]